MQLTDDITLIRKLQEGDKNTFKNIFDSYYVPLCRFVNTSLNNTSEAEEIVQDLFVRLWEKRDSIAIQISLKSYLFQAAKHKALNYIRDNEKMVYCDKMPFEEVYEDDNLELKELQNLIQEAICSLPEKCNEIFKLSREKHYSNAEIAEMKNISIRTVDHQILHAMQKIREYLGKQYTYLF